MSLLRRNVLANFAASACTAAVSLIFAPLHVRLMGVESYGLVGLFITMQAMLSVLDLGLSATVTRETARLSTQPKGRAATASLLRGSEVVYWGVGLAGGFVIALLASPISSHWLHPASLDGVTTRQALVVMGVLFAVQWPQALYGGALQGLQRQVPLNIAAAAAALVRAAGGALVLWKWSPTPVAFLWWQALVAVLQTHVLAVLLWRCVGKRPNIRRADWTHLTSLWRFAAGMTIIAFQSTLLTHLDRIIVSRTLPLESLGYYALAGGVAASLYRLITPIFAATYPRLSQLVAADDRQGLSALFHRSSQMVAAIAAPAALFAALFAHELLLFWTGNAALTAGAQTVLSLLVLGTALNGLMNIPFATLLAHGSPRIVVILNSIAVAVLLPALWYVTPRWGAVGAACGWLGYNLANALLMPVLLHRRVLRGELARWWVGTASPVAACAAVGVAARQAFAAPGLFSLVAIGLLMQLAALATSREVTRWLRASLHGRPGSVPAPV